MRRFIWWALILGALIVAWRMGVFTRLLGA